MAVIQFIFYLHSIILLEQLRNGVQSGHVSKSHAFCKRAKSGVTCCEEEERAGDAKLARRKKNPKKKEK